MSQGDEVELGILRLGRKSQADCGRLTLDARFDVTGPMVLKLDTQTTNAPVARELVAGSYAITIWPDFRLWCDVAVAQLQVTAELTGHEQQSFEIAPGASTRVAYEFAVDGEIAVFDAD